MDYLLVTRSEKGMTLINDEVEHHVPSYAQEVFDVSGAGDTVIAVMAVYLSYGYIIEEAIDMAVSAAEIVIGKVGTVPITYEEIEKKE
jgi:D-beta-D-heptose 7-phosphate kinase/D-beta-D-heptose 1-phosphate adenosyltransferase